jgi:hypothetical protein
VRLHRELLRDITPRQNLDRLPHAVNEPGLAQQLRRDDRAFSKTLGQRVEVHDRVLGAELIVEPALRHATMQRHLAAFESPLELVAGTRLRAFVPTTRLHTVTGALAAADALLGKLRPFGRFQIAQIHGYSETSTRCRTL